MYATVREGTFDPTKLERGQAATQEFARLRAGQPGYAGSVSVDAGGGRRLIVTLFETAETATAARAVLEPESARLMGPLTAAGAAGGSPMRVLGEGPVAQTDLTKS